MYFCQINQSKYYKPEDKIEHWGIIDNNSNNVQLFEKQQSQDFWSIFRGAQVLILYRHTYVNTPELKP